MGGVHFVRDRFVLFNETFQRVYLDPYSRGPREEAQKVKSKRILAYEFQAPTKPK